MTAQPLFLILASLLEVLFFIDMMQTLKFRSWGHRELNPILGKYPSPEKVVAYFLIILAAAPLFLLWSLSEIGEYAYFLLILFLILQGTCVVKNHLKGY